MAEIELVGGDAGKSEAGIGGARGTGGLANVAGEGGTGLICLLRVVQGLVSGERSDSGLDGRGLGAFFQATFFQASEDVRRKRRGTTRLGNGRLAEERDFCRRCEEYGRRSTWLGR